MHVGAKKKTEADAPSLYRHTLFLLHFVLLQFTGIVFYKLNTRHSTSKKIMS